ncbi:hypothetical protein [Pannonibacter phragmitetus]|nr:hypothetical protein [Pannonibacter phragmitetus]
MPVFAFIGLAALIGGRELNPVGYGMMTVIAIVFLLGIIKVAFGAGD